mmetsp:Transcript_3833/g.5553  ORF Transcript_3833/g.5553 Transcript_3833/m.5553 type:complete len:102 (-) Transcript_3833:232-537(-)
MCVFGAALDNRSTCAFLRIGASNFGVRFHRCTKRANRLKIPFFFGKSAWPFDVTSASHVTQNTHMNKHTNTQARTHTHTHKHAHTTYKYDNAHVHCVDVCE